MIPVTPRRIRTLRLLLVGLLLLVSVQTGLAQPERWKDDVARLGAVPALEPGGVVFVGSSSIRLWKTLAADFPGERTVNMGFGGSELADSVFHFDTLVARHAPGVVVVYAGENDLAAGKAPEKVAADFRAFRARLQAARPEAKLLYISAKPSPSRMARFEAFREANRLIAAECAADARCGFVDVFSLMLDAGGQPREDLFVGDRLHMNARGYAIWTAAVTQALAEIRRR